MRFTIHAASGMRAVGDPRRILTTRLVPDVRCPSARWREGGSAGMGESVLIQDAAARLGVSRRTVYYRIRAGRLRTVRTRGGSQRVLVASIDALLKEKRAAVPIRQSI